LTMANLTILGIFYLYTLQSFKMVSDLGDSGII